MKNPNGRLSSPFNDEYRKPVSWKPVFVFGLHRKHKIFKKWITTLWTWKALVWVTQQHDSFLYTGWHKKTVITKNRITSKILFRLTQNFSYIRSSLCSRHLRSFKSVLQKLFVSLALKNVLQLSSLALQTHLNPAGKVIDDPSAILPWDRFYCCCDCCLQVRDSLGVVSIHSVLKESPQVKIWGVQVRCMRRPLRVTPAADQSVRETLL